MGPMPFTASSAKQSSGSTTRLRGSIAAWAQVRPLDCGREWTWSKTITASGLFTDSTVSAQNTDSGSITCTITEDGKVLNTNTATGQFAIATCTATATT